MFHAAVIGLSMLKPRFDLDPIRAIQMVGKMAFGQAVLRVLRFGSVSNTPQMVYDHNCLNPLNPELNPFCYLLAFLAHHFLHVSSIRDKSLTLGF